MTPMENLLDQIVNIKIWGVVKIFYLLAILLYLGFAFMIIREVDLMNKTIKGVFNLPIKLIALIHFTFAVLVLLLAITVL